MRKTIESWVADFITIPYTDLGRDRSGVDCWGGVRLVLKDQFDIDVAELDPEYKSSTDRVSILDAVNEEMESGRWVEVSDPQVGDIALMKYERQHHVGICVAGGDDPAVLHWLENRGAAVERLSCVFMSGAVRSWWRISKDSASLPAQACHTPAEPCSWSIQTRTIPIGSQGPCVPRPEGETIRDMVIAVIGEDSIGRAIVTLGGREIPVTAWGLLKPKAGATLGLLVIPAGGGEGKSPLRTILMIAVIAASAFGPGLLGLEAGTAAFGFASGAIALAGGFLINTLAPPPSLDFGAQASEDFAPSISGGRNSARQFRAIPMNLGENRVVPALAALPYTETVGDDQYLRQLFVVSYGPQEIDEIKIGNTPIEDFTDVQIEIRRGFPGEDPVTLYPGVVIEDQFSIAVDFLGPPSFALDGRGANQSITFPADLVEDDVIELTATGTVDLSNGKFTTNAAGVIVSPDPTFNGLSPGETYLTPNRGGMVIWNGSAWIAFFDDTLHGLGSGTPTTTVTQAVRLGDIMSQAELDVIGAVAKFRVEDNGYGDNSGEFAVTVDDGPGWISRTSATDADELAVELTAPSGLGKFVGGVLQPIEIKFEIEYRKVGDTDWLKVLDEDGASENERLDDFFGGPNSEFFYENLAHGDTIGATGSYPNLIHWSHNNDNIGSTGKPREIAVTTAGGGVGKNWAIEYEMDLNLTSETSDTYGFGNPPYDLQFAMDGVGPFELYVDDALVLSKYTEDAPAGSGGTPDFSVHQSAVIRFDTYRSDIRLRIRVARTKASGDAVDYGAMALGWKFTGDPSFTVIPERAAFEDPALLGFPGGTYAGWSPAFSSPILKYYRITDPSGGNELTFFIASNNRVRRTITWAVDRAQYEVRVRRVTPMFDSSSVIESVSWTALRTLRNEYPINKDCLAVIAIRIKATGQLNGVIDELSCRARSIGLDYEAVDDVWIQRVTSNPASLYRLALQGKANGRRDDFPDSKIDIAHLEYWHGLNITRGLEFNAVIEQRRTLYQILNAIASTGRGSFTLGDGLFSVVVDEVKTTPVQHITPRNSSGFSASRVFPNNPHALRVQFPNKEQSYQQDERIVLDDGYQHLGVDAFGDPGGALPEATKFETLTLYGVTSPDEVWKHGRYHLAVLRLRPERFNVTMDMESLACQRGDMVLFTHDVPLVGIGYGRIHEREVDGSGELFKLHIDDEFTFESGKSYQARIRRADGSSEVHPLTTSPGTISSIELTTPVPLPQADWPVAGDLVQLGEVDNESIELVVDQIQPSDDLSASLRLVNHSPGIHTADQGTIPPFDSGVTNPPGTQLSPDDPTISNVASDFTVSTINPDGTITPMMVVSVSNPPSTSPPAMSYESLYRRKAGTGETAAAYTSLPDTPAADGVITIVGVVVGETYEIRVRAKDSEGRVSNFVDTEHTVVGWNLLPDPVASFNVTELGDSTRRFTWTLGSTAANLNGVEIRYADSTAEGWDDLIPISSSTFSSSPFDTDDPAAGTWMFGISVFDLQGNESTATLVTETLGASPSGDTVDLYNARISGWTGTLTQCWENAENCLEVDDTTDWDALASGSVTWDGYTRWNRTPKTSMSYVHQYDAGSVQTLRVSMYARSEGGTRVDDVRFSDDAIVWTDWAVSSTVDNVPTSARYVEIRSTITGDGSDVLVLCQQAITVRR